MFSIHTAITAIALAIAGIAQAAEFTEFPLETGQRSRAEVAAEARNAPRTDELYDGSPSMAAPQSTRSRDEVRAEAKMAREAKPTTDLMLHVGGE